MFMMKVASLMAAAIFFSCTEATLIHEGKIYLRGQSLGQPLIGPNLPPTNWGWNFRCAKQNQRRAITQYQSIFPESDTRPTGNRTHLS